jgi:putative transposase
VREVCSALGVSRRNVTDRLHCSARSDARRFATALGLKPVTMPIESLQSNEMAQSFVNTCARDYTRLEYWPDSQTVVRSSETWFEHYNESGVCQGSWNMSHAAFNSF